MGDTDPGEGCIPAPSDEETRGTSQSRESSSPQTEQNDSEAKNDISEDIGDVASESSGESAESLSNVNTNVSWIAGQKPQSTSQPSYRMGRDDKGRKEDKSDICSEEEIEDEEENENEEDEEDADGEEEEEEVDEEEDELGSEEEELEEGKLGAENAERDAVDTEKEEEKSSFGLYSGMSDIISESPQSAPSPTPSSCSSTPSLTPNKPTPVGVQRPNSTFSSSLVYKGGGGGLLVHHPVTPKKRVLTKTKTDHLSEELNLGYRILVELMSDYQKGSNAPFMEPIELDPEKNKDYLEVITKPLWLKKIKEQLLDGHYKTITELIGDLRLMLENAYRYYGPANSISKKGLRLEHMMEQKIALLPKEIRECCSLEKTSGQPPEDITQTHRNKTAKISVNGDNFFSYVLYRVRGCRGQRDKELKKRKMEAMRQAKRDRELEVIQWEKDLLKEPLFSQMRAMWELPQIGHFIFLTLNTLNIYEVPQYELERMLLMPRASRTLAMLLTSLLSSPQQRQKLNEKPYMPYRVWARKLAHKTLLWYRCFSRENQNSQKVFDQMGIEPQFWNICGPTNPFERLMFHEMTYHQRVWLLKSLCDFLLHNHKTVQEVIAEHAEADQREYHLGRDRDGNEYLHFPQFCGQDLRIYRRAQVPSPEMTIEEEEHVEGSILPIEKIREFKKMMKRIRSKHQDEAEWEGSRGKKRKRKRGRNREVDPEEEVGLSSRSRPGNLRQRPRTRYKDQYEDLGLSSDEDPPRPKMKGRKSNVIDSSSENDQQEEEEKEKEKEKEKEDKKEKEKEKEDKKEEKEKDINGTEDTPAPEPSPPPPPLLPPPPEETPEDTGANSPAPPQQEGLTRAQQKNPRTKRGGKKKPTCEICGKTFQNIAALKGHRAVHTKEKQKLAAMEEISNSSKVSAERTGDILDKQSGLCNSAIVQNGECDPEENSKREKDLTSESLLNGKIKEERPDFLEENEDSKPESLSVKVEPKSEEVEVKEEMMDGDESDVKENFECNGTTKTEEDKTVSQEEAKVSREMAPLYNPARYLPRLEDFELVVASVEQLRALIKKFGDLPENAGGSSSNSKEGEQEPEEGEEEEESEEGNKKSKEEDSPQEKRPKCEVKLHRALCNLLNELSPWESKLLAANKRMRTKMRQEWNEFQKRGEDYIDPAEEAWASDPEPEPEPPPPPPQESSSSSSSSEESLDEEGNPKRKLRKRRAKQQAANLIMENTAPLPEVSSVATPEETSDGYAVSSRGRVRKVKKLINYDGLDFEKLADQASQEAEQERLRKKRKREEEKEKEEQDYQLENSNANNARQPMSGVKRYLLSQTGRVMGYIDSEGQVHSGTAVKDGKGDRGVDIPSVRNLATQLVSGAKKDGTQTQIRTGVNTPNRTVQNTTLKPGIPTVVVAAINNQGSPVYVRVVGEQALQLVKYMRPSTKGPVSQIKLQHHGQTYTVNTNAHMITHNIPGMPDGEAAEKPSPSTTQSGNSAVPPTSSLTQPRPTTGLQSLATSNSPSVPKVAPVSTVVTSTPNTLALAYRGVAKTTRPLSISTPSRPAGTLIPGAVAVQNPNHQPAIATTRLVSASPSVVSSVMPPTVRNPASLASSTPAAVTLNQKVNRQAAPTIIASSPRAAVTPVVNRIAAPGITQSNLNNNPNQPGTPVAMQQQQAVAQQQQQAVDQTQSNLATTQPLGQVVTATTMAMSGSGGQVQLKLESESLAQLMQRTGSKIVALPNGRGGYTLSLTPGVVPPGQAGQKSQQSQIAANTAAKVQVVSCTAPILQDGTPSAPQQQPVVQQQAHVISPQAVSRATTVAHPTMATVPRATGVVQQQVVRQVVPVTQAQQQTVYQRVSVPQRVYNQLVTATSNAPATTSVPTSQLATTVVNANQVQNTLQPAVVQKAAAPQTVSFQATSPGGQQQQFVVQQRVVHNNQTPQGASAVVQQGGSATTPTFKPVVISQGVQQGAQVVRVAHTPVIQQQQQQQQVVRLQHASQPNAQKLVQIVQQPGGGRQVVQMVQQVVATQAQATAGHQGLIYVQGPGQIIQQQPKTSLGTIQQPQQQVVVGQVAQQQIVQQQQVPVQAQTQTQIVQQQQILRQQPQSTAQQTVAQQPQSVVQPQQAAPQQQQTQTQVQQGRLVLLRTNQGEQVGLQHADGRVTLLSQEQLQAVIRNGSIKVTQQT